ncbi:Transcriptional adapter ada2 [Dinochytrium kinnereticum]|nr:Transcriptional adapter ada2 [Dinochytrium kinnereticum]
MSGPVTDRSDAIDDDFCHKYHCDACEKDITNLVRVTCAECKEGDADLDFCVDCFSSGREVKGHKNTHSYMVKECLDFPLFSPTWTAQEELALVDSLKTFGIGNWEQIADHIGTKDKYEVGKHYNEIFVDSENWPLPSIQMEFDKAASRLLIQRDLNPVVRKPFRACTSGPANHEIAGFMPGREEFETEFDNEAEASVKDMVFDDNEPPEEVLLKTTILNIYNTTLDRRMERKKFTKERGLTHDFRKIINNEKKRPKEEKDLLNRIRVFAKMQTADDFDKFTEGLLHEQKLRARIAQLQEHRRMGITGLKEAADYERDKLQRSLTMKTTTHSLRDMTGLSRYPARAKFDEISPPRTLNPVMTRQGSSSSVSGNGGPNGPKRAAPLDISASDGVDMLLPNEQQLCSNLRILPRAYLVIKETLLREYASRGYLKRRQAREIIKIDVNKTSQIYDLFVLNGWIKSK